VGERRTRSFSYCSFSGKIKARKDVEEEIPDEISFVSLDEYYEKYLKEGNGSKLFPIGTFKLFEEKVDRIYERITKKERER